MICCRVLRVLHAVLPAAHTKHDTKHQCTQEGQLAACIHTAAPAAACALLDSHLVL
jgi:hypothetical protein